MIDFGFSEIAASDLLLANDVAELVASSSAVVGAERATAHAIASVDAATLAAARDRLQLWALSGASRTALKERPGSARRPPGSARTLVSTAPVWQRRGRRRARPRRRRSPAARGPAIPAWEQRLFRAVNGLPRWLFVPLWPVMQLGNLAVGTVAGLVVALARRESCRWPSACVLATGLKLVAERLIRREITAHLPARQRPGTSQPGADPPRRRRADERAELPVGARRARRRHRPASSRRSSRPAGSSSRRCSRCGVMVGRVLRGRPQPARRDQRRRRRADGRRPGRRASIP